MKNILLILLTFFSVTLYSQVSVLKQGGEKATGTATEQVLSWDGTTWTPGTNKDFVGTNEASFIETYVTT